jgi:GAF domain-containing protein
MDENKKAGRYRRIYEQLSELTKKCNDPVARMATICAVLHYKMEYYFWTGFYLLDQDKEKLVVGPYQGPVACQELEPRKGVCWAAVDRAEPVVVEDVHAFPGHIGCDSRSQSEIAVPVKDSHDDIKAVFDVDSDKPGSFSQIDSMYLQQILELIYR